jgi:hypothetical protein
LEYAAKTIIRGERQLGLGLIVGIRVSVSTLKVCCGWKTFVSFLNTYPVEARVAMILERLGNENSLQMCGEVYGIVESTTSIIVREFCVAIKKHLKPSVRPKLTRNKIKEITIGFECLHGVPYILGAINGSYVPIITPKVDPKSYYYQKGFYSKLIQGVVDAKCSF